MSARSEVEAAEARPPTQARGRCRALVTDAGVCRTRPTGRQATRRSPGPVDVTRPPRKAQRRPRRRRTCAELAKLKKQEQKIKQQILAAAAADHSAGYVGATTGS